MMPDWVYLSIVSHQSIQSISTDKDNSNILFYQQVFSNCFVNPAEQIKNVAWILLTCILLWFIPTPTALHL